MYLRILCYTILDLTMTILACLFINWWAPAFSYLGSVQDGAVTKVGHRLPEWLAWFDTFDGTLDDGLLPGEVSTYWTRTRWLYRNPAYGFSYWVLGIDFYPKDWAVIGYSADPFRFLAEDRFDNFNYMAVVFGVKFKIGWKAWNYFDTETLRWKMVSWGPVWRAPFVFSVSIAK